MTRIGSQRYRKKKKSFLTVALYPPRETYKSSKVNGHRDGQLYFTSSSSTVLCSVPCAGQNEEYLVLESASFSGSCSCFSRKEFWVPGFIMALLYPAVD